MIDDALKYYIIDELFCGDEGKNWERSDKEYDLDSNAHIEVDVEPEDAKTINEVDSFTLYEDVSGVIIHHYKRKVKQ